MVCLLLDFKVKAGVSIENYYNLRHMFAGRTITNTGRWSEQWACSVLRWHHHCLRAHDTHMWHAAVLAYRNAIWFEKRRSFFGKGIVSRTCTRLSSGKVSQRWSECIDSALEIAPAWTAATREHELNVRSILVADIRRT